MTSSTILTPDTMLATLRASAARLDPDRADRYHCADRELWQQAADAVLDLLVLGLRYRRQDLDGAAFRREVARLVHRTDETLFIAALTWQLETFELLNASCPRDSGEHGGVASRAIPTGA